MTVQRGAPVTINAVSWLLSQSQAQRGRVAPVENTCPTFFDYQLLLQGTGGAGRTRLLQRVAYPEPTPVTITATLTQDNLGALANSFGPRLMAWPPPTGSVVDVSYTTFVGCLLVEWILAGASFAAVIDLGAGVLSIPAVDQVTVSYAAHVASPGFNVQLAILPVLSPVAVATRTGIPALVAAGTSTTYVGRQGYARRWKVTAAEEPLAFPLPGPIGPIVVRCLDTLTLGNSAEIVTFADFTATAGIPAVQQGWIECGAGVTAYEIINLGAVAVKARIIEQIQVA